MGVAAVVGLMIEQMQQDVLQRLAVWLARHVLVVKDLAEIGLAIGSDQIDQACIFGDPAAQKFAAIVMDDGVEPSRMFAGAGQALQPDAIGQQQMIQRAVQAAEENAGGPAVLFLGDCEGGAVDPKVGPAIIVGKLPKDLDRHGDVLIANGTGVSLRAGRD